MDTNFSTLNYLWLLKTTSEKLLHFQKEENKKNKIIAADLVLNTWLLIRDIPNSILTEKLQLDTQDWIKKFSNCISDFNCLSVSGEQLCSIRKNEGHIWGTSKSKSVNVFTENLSKDCCVSSNSRECASVQHIVDVSLRYLKKYIAINNDELERKIDELECKIEEEFAVQCNNMIKKILNVVNVEKNNSNDINSFVASYITSKSVTKIIQTKFFNENCGIFDEIFYKNYVDEVIEKYFEKNSLNAQ